METYSNAHRGPKRGCLTQGALEGLPYTGGLRGKVTMTMTMTMTMMMMMMMMMMMALGFR